MMWSVVELREIRVFLTLADELHFGRTAERLQLTSSRVSQILRELERKLGVQRLHRTSRRVELTRPARGSSTRRGRPTPSIMAVWLPHAQPDMVVGPTLVQEPRVLAVSHALAKQSSVSVEELADYRVGHVPGLATEFHDAWVPSKTASGRPIHSDLLDNTASGDLGDMTLELGYRVASGRLVHPTVPSLVKVWGHLDIAYVPINDMPPMRSVLVCAADPTVRDFIRTAREILSAVSVSRRMVAGGIATGAEVGRNRVGR